MTALGWVVVAYLAAVNVITVAIYAWDKRAASRGTRRVAERSLLTAALLGGSPAAFVAGRVMRHKTVKWSFRIRFALVVLLQLALLGFAVYSLYGNR